MPTTALHSIHVHPVKALRGQSPHKAVVEPWGLAGDRRWAIVDEAGSVVTQREQPRLALAAAEPLPCGGVRVAAAGLEPLSVAVPEEVGTRTARWSGEKIETITAGPEASEWFSTYLGESVTLVHLDDPATRRPIDDPQHGRPGETVSLADAYPLLLTTLTSLDALNSLIVQGDRPDEGPLPMNRFRPNVVVSGTAPWAEDDWRGIAIGDVVFRVAKMCSRCVVTTTDQTTTERGKEPLRTLARHRRFGNRLVFGQYLVPQTPGAIRIGDPVTVLE
ncbi:MOSC domain-containing protein [Streptomyces colonosanans]|uniref:MOSC domain-containing protein n=1 Tax=Streptomyces colonosanans TaxID=1428652 RepID=A0A1S2PQA8_9ACTN|nr:MOSC N-terminal beta barrel domain-containing protein [Streptomyces colonosanans]OIJ95969.1 MOSC domain-containing protein [Streptomyces colonosanans]